MIYLGAVRKKRINGKSSSLVLILSVLSYYLQFLGVPYISFHNSPAVWPLALFNKEDQMLFLNILKNVLWT